MYVVEGISWRDKLVSVISEEAAKNNLNLKLGVPPALASLPPSQLCLDITHLFEDRKVPAVCKVHPTNPRMLLITIDPSWELVGSAEKKEAGGQKESQSFFSRLFKKKR